MASSQITGPRIGRVRGQLDDITFLLDRYLQFETAMEKPDQRVLVALESAGTHISEAIDELSLLLALLNSKLPSAG